MPRVNVSRNNYITVCPLAQQNNSNRGGWGKSGHFYCFCLGNFLNESSEAIDFHVKVAFTHGFKADIVISRVGPYGAHIF